MILSVIKVFFPAAFAFFLGILLTPFLTKYFYKYKMWKKSSRSSAELEMGEEFKKVHNEIGELSTPRVGGIIIWLTVLITTVIFAVLPYIFPGVLTEKMAFFSRNQTLLPLFTLLTGSLLGLVDDVLQIMGKGAYAKDNIVYRKVKIITLSIIGFGVGWWFFYKLGMDSIHIPFGGDVYLGLFFIPLFIIVMLAVFSGSVIDGIDGLSGGVLGSIFLALTTIAFFNNQIDLAAFCAVVTGGILAFLWFNIPPARFYMGETGMLGLTVTVATVAFLTDSVLLLPIIAFPLVITSLSVIIQIISYKYFGKKRVFKVAPLHHHFEAIGWSKYRVTMRYWILGVVFAIIGMLLSLVS